MRRFLSCGIFLVPLVAGALLVAGCGRNGKDKSSDKSARATTAKVERRDLDFAVEVSGDLRPSVQVDVKAEVSGKIKKIPIVLGQTVKKDTLLLELDDSDLLTEKASTQIEIDGMKLQLSKASLNAERARQLLASDLIPQQDADNLKLDAEIAVNGLDKARKKLQTVEDKLTKTRILAPLDGVVVTLPVVEGQVVVGGPSVSAGTPLMTMANLSEMLISTHINQMDVTRMKVDQAVQVTVDAFEGLVLAGKISFVAPVATIKNNIKGFAVDVLVASCDSQVRPGMSANVKIPISKVQAALSVPIETVFREGDKRVVYVKEGERFARREVEIGVTTTDRTEIRKGLQEGEIISLTRPKEEGARPAG